MIYISVAAWVLTVQEYSLQLFKEVGYFIVVERDACIIACGALIPFNEEKCAEVAALAVAAECRRHGQGDKLLGKKNVIIDLL